MDSTKLQAAEQALIERALRNGGGLDRRRFLISAAASVTAATLPGGTEGQVARPIARAARAIGVPANELMASRHRPAFVKDVAHLVDLNGFNQGGAYWNYATYMTPVEDFFIRNEYPTPRAASEPRVDPRFWKLKIHGNGIERPLTLGYEDLLRLPSRTITSVMECAGNGRSLYWEQQGMVADPTEVTGTGWGLGGIGQAEFEFVPISAILDLVGLKKEAMWALFWSGIDTKTPGAPGDNGRPVPAQLLRQMSRSIGLAFKMNGKPLTPDHGAPVRALVPGWCGAASTKWLSEIKIATHNFWVPLNSFRHVMIGPRYAVPKPAEGDEFRFSAPEKVRGPMVTWLPAKSLITVPLVLEKQPKFPHNYPLRPGELPRLPAAMQVIRGYAWAPQAGVRRVEVRINGTSWQRARIVDPVLSRFAWVRFELPWHPAPGRYVVETRVTDARGRSQPFSVPYNKGGFDFEAVPRFHIDVV